MPLHEIDQVSFIAHSNNACTLFHLNPDHLEVEPGAARGRCRNCPAGAGCTRGTAGACPAASTPRGSVVQLHGQTEIAAAAGQIALVEQRELRPDRVDAHFREVLQQLANLPARVEEIFFPALRMGANKRW